MLYVAHVFPVAVVPNSAGTVGFNFVQPVDGPVVETNADIELSRRILEGAEVNSVLTVRLLVKTRSNRGGRLFLVLSFYNCGCPTLSSITAPQSPRNSSIAGVAVFSWLVAFCFFIYLVAGKVFGNVANLFYTNLPALSEGASAVESNRGAATLFLFAPPNAALGFCLSRLRDGVHTVSSRNNCDVKLCKSSVGQLLAHRLRSLVLKS